MKNPRTGGAGVPESAVSRQLDCTQDSAPTSPSVVTTPRSSLDTALDHLDDAGLCACWTSPYPRRCRRWSR